MVVTAVALAKSRNNRHKSIQPTEKWSWDIMHPRREAAHQGAGAESPLGHCAEEKSSSPGGLKCQGDVFINIYSSFGNPEEAGNNFGKLEEAGNSGEVWDLSERKASLYMPFRIICFKTFFQFKKRNFFRATDWRLETETSSDLMKVSDNLNTSLARIMTFSLGSFRNRSPEKTRNYVADNWLQRSAFCQVRIILFTVSPSTVKMGYELCCLLTH